MVGMVLVLFVSASTSIFAVEMNQTGAAPPDHDARTWCVLTGAVRPQIPAHFELCDAGAKTLLFFRMLLPSTTPSRMNSCDKLFTVAKVTSTINSYTDSGTHCLF